IGNTVQVLVEEARDGLCKGHTEHYLPAHFPADGTLKGQVVQVDVQEASADFVSGVKKKLSTQPCDRIVECEDSDESN
ncbi:MAG: hypothetical protein K9M45_12725, partial [Kiritimatiellales bacterium]|nr:hypothetical protein [Kiritimatiellales bacterium]